jgi:hypothetical protein
MKTDTKTKSKLIHKQMIAIMNDVGAIKKDKKNGSALKYAFRGIDDVYNSLHSVMAKHKVYSVPEVINQVHEERRSKAGASLIYRVLTIKYTFYAEDGSSVSATVVGEGMDSGDKASNKAMSVADKYCLVQAFKIPVSDMVDPDSETPPESTPMIDEVKMQAIQDLRSIYSEAVKLKITINKTQKDFVKNAEDNSLDLIKSATQNLTSMVEKKKCS